MARSLSNLGRLLDAVNKKLPTEQMFLTDLKKSIELSAEKEARKPSQTYKPSSMNCIRAMYYMVTGAEGAEDIPSYCSVGICNSGSDIHVRIQQAVTNMKELGMDCEYIDVAEFVKQRNIPDLEVVDHCGMETKLYHKSLNMSFLSDGVIRYQGHYYVLEIKTEASFKWTSRTGVDAKHYRQGTAYSYALQIPDVIFLYINRDVLDMKAYMFTPTEEMKRKLVGDIARCDEYIACEELPPKPTDLPPTTCRYCGYVALCEANEKGAPDGKA